MTTKTMLAIGIAGIAVLLPLGAREVQVETQVIAATPLPAVTAPPVAAPMSAPVRRKLVAMARVAEPEAAPQYASIAGTVRDPSGAVVPNCEVRLSSPDGSNRHRRGDGQRRRLSFRGCTGGGNVA